MIAEVSDNISDHSFRVAVIGLILAELEKCDGNKVLKMALFHDVVEARTGDANFINQQYLKMDEEGARADQMNGLPIEEEMLSLFEEYENRQSIEAIVAKEADLLDQMILQQEYFYKDKENGRIWQDHTENQLKTKNAKELAAKIRTSNPFQWLYHLAEDKTGRKIRKFQKNHSRSS
jgi:putative hydrolase of HD superfamily